MKGMFSLAIAIMAAALAVGVPSAFADPGLDGAPEMSTTSAPDWFERAAAAAGERRGAVAPYVDAFERPGVSGLQATAPDWFERAAAVAVQDSARAPYVDAFERPSPGLGFEATLASTSSESGSDIAWGQIGLAFAIGLLLALGLGMVMRLTNRTDVVGHER